MKLPLTVVYWCASMMIRKAMMRACSCNPSLPMGTLHGARNGRAIRRASWKKGFSICFARLEIQSSNRPPNWRSCSLEQNFRSRSLSQHLATVQLFIRAKSSCWDPSSWYKGNGCVGRRFFASRWTTTSKPLCKLGRSAKQAKWIPGSKR